jgi:hypothetical protein
LSDHCPRAVACMGSAAPMHAPSVFASLLELAAVTATCAVLVRTIWILRATHRACRALTTVATPPALAASVARTGIGRVRCVATAPTPVFCHGVVRRVVIIEKAALRSLSASALDAVLFHEESHRRHHDPLRRAVRAAAADVAFQNSLARWWSHRAAVREELRADLWAARWVGSPALAGALFSLAPTPDLKTVPAFGDAADARVAQLLGDRPLLPVLPRGALLRAGFATLSLLALVMCAAMPSI